tara:strand:+ start:63 stop:248 length:186 start_codon:yes stop_codon:yes gene_type:complete
MKVYTEKEILTAVYLATDSTTQCDEVLGILKRINEDNNFAKELNLEQPLHLKKVLLKEGKL